MLALACPSFTPGGDVDDFGNVVSVLRVRNLGIVMHPIRQPAVLLDVLSQRSLQITNDGWPFTDSATPVKLMSK